MADCPQGGVHSFDTQTGFFKDKRICTKCGHEDADLGTGIMVTGVLSALAAIFAIDMTNPDPPDPLEG